MPRPILVGFDPTTRDHAPVDFGIMVARVTRAPLVVCSVLASPRPLALGSEQTAAYATVLEESLVDDGGEALRGLEEELLSEPIRAELRLLYGNSAARALHEAAAEERAALIVVGSSRRAEGRLRLGSTAERLIHGAPAPVAAVPSEWTPPDGGLRCIGVGFVDTKEGREALRGALAIARRAGATVRVITVVKPRPSWYAETEATTPIRPGKGITEIKGEHRVDAEEHVRRVVAPLAPDGPVQVDAFVGDPADRLVELSDRLNLLVVGSRSYGPLSSVLLGGVSRRVVAEAHCPTIVLVRGVDGALEELLTETAGAAAPG